MSEEVEKVEKTEEKTNKTNGGKGFAIASMVLGIVSLVIFCFWFISVPCAILAIIFSVVAKKKAGKSGMTTAGLVLGIVTLGILAVFMFLAAIGVSTMMNSNFFNQIEQDAGYSTSRSYDYNYDF